jgi:hypothetical protein
MFAFVGNIGLKKTGAPFFENGCALFEKRMHPFQKEVGVSKVYVQVVNNGDIRRIK